MHRSLLRLNGYGVYHWYYLFKGMNAVGLSCFLYFFQHSLLYLAKYLSIYCVTKNRHLSLVAIYSSTYITVDYIFHEIKSTYELSMRYWESSIKVHNYYPVCCSIRYYTAAAVEYLRTHSWFIYPLGYLINTI